jgi:hypothetical protein
MQTFLLLLILFAVCVVSMTFTPPERRHTAAVVLAVVGAIVYVLWLFDFTPARLGN